MASEFDSKINVASLVVAVVLCLMFCGFFAANYLLNSDEPVQAELTGRINPNIANVASMSRLPSIGMVTAEAIVAYREKVSDDIAFKSSSDLQKVKGIGAKTVENIKEWLVFE